MTTIFGLFHLRSNRTAQLWRLIRLSMFDVLTCQAEGIAVFEHNKKTVEQKGKVLFQLQKICRDLQIIDEVSDKEEAVIARVISHLTERIQEIPESLLRNPPKILARLNHDGRSVDEVLSLQQKEKVSRMVEILYEVNRFLFSTLDRSL